MDWGQVVSGLIGAGLGTAIVEGAVTIFQQFRAGRSHGKFLAFRIAVELEAYAERCLNVIFDTHNYESSRGAMGKLFVSLPPFPSYPDDIEGWRNLPPQVLDMAYRLRAQHDSKQHGLDFLLNNIGFEEASEQCMAHCATLGRDALRIAASIRQYYGFPTISEEQAELLDIETRRPEHGAA